MQYTSYRFRIIQKSEELAVIDAFDILSASLIEVGFDSFVPSEDHLEAFIPTSQATDEDIDTLLAKLPLPGLLFTYDTVLIPDQNWNEEWEQYYFSPIDIDGRCYIRAPFHPAAPEGIEIELVISPKMAFGTGHHQTTSLILRYLLSLADEGRMSGKRLIDVGCGSGILGILAAKVGAEFVQAIDIDDCCVDSSTENASINGVESLVKATQGDAAHLPFAVPYDLILANITLNINKDSLPSFVRLLAPDGLIICSGFFLRDVEILADAACRVGLCVDEVCTQVSPSGDEWAMVVFKRQ